LGLAPPHLRSCPLSLAVTFSRWIELPPSPFKPSCTPVSLYRLIHDLLSAFVDTPLKSVMALLPSAFLALAVFFFAAAIVSFSLDPLTSPAISWV